jgi:hypothetical protein
MSVDNKLPEPRREGAPKGGGGVHLELCKIGLISERKFRKDEADDRCRLDKIHEHVPQNVEHPSLRARHLPHNRRRTFQLATSAPTSRNLESATTRAR